MYRSQVNTWTLERAICLMAGGFTLLGLFLAMAVHPYWLALPALVGLNLVVFSVTGFCPMAVLLHAVGVRPECGT